MSQQIVSTSNLKVWTIIPAAGSGSRFSKVELKQYQQIADKTVLEHTVSRLKTLPLLGCVLAIGEHDTFVQTLDFAKDTDTYFCQGGSERVYSVLNALNYLSEFANPNDWVLVHDAARPCVSMDSLTALWQCVEQSQQAAILATPVRDTLKRVVDGVEINETVDRAQLWQAQTPQMAPLAILKQSIEQALAQNAVITDEASALEFVGHRVNIVMGRADNIKITYPDDLSLAQLILGAQDASKK